MRKITTKLLKNICFINLIMNFKGYMSQDYHRPSFHAISCMAISETLKFYNFNTIINKKGLIVKLYTK